MSGIEQFLRIVPAVDYYLLVDSDTVVFRDILNLFVQRLEENVNPEKHVYLGQGFLLENRTSEFITTGSGALLRGHSMRMLLRRNRVQDCAARAEEGDWCWNHLDWTLGSCLRQVGVRPQSHAGFRQWADKKEIGCPMPSITCHKFAEPVVRSNLMQDQRVFLRTPVNRRTLDARWASPSKHDAWNWTDFAR